MALAHDDANHRISRISCKERIESMMSGAIVPAHLSVYSLYRKHAKFRQVWWYRVQHLKRAFSDSNSDAKISLSELLRHTLRKTLSVSFSLNYKESCTIHFTTNEYGTVNCIQTTTFVKTFECRFR